MGRRCQSRPEEKADSKRKRSKEKTEDLLQNACAFHCSQQTLLPDDRLSIRQTAVKFDVSYFTLRNRINIRMHDGPMSPNKASASYRNMLLCLVVVYNKEALRKKTFPCLSSTPMRLACHLLVHMPTYIIDTHPEPWHLRWQGLNHSILSCRCLPRPLILSLHVTILLTSLAWSILLYIPIIHLSILPLIMVILFNCK